MAGIMNGMLISMIRYFLYVLFLIISNAVLENIFELNTLHSYTNKPLKWEWSQLSLLIMETKCVGKTFLCKGKFN
jgi:hypothetical protein